MKNYFDDVNTLTLADFEAYYDAGQKDRFKGYRDADAHSIQLYKDFSEAFGFETPSNWKPRKLRIKLNGINFSTDYIGPSRAKAYKAGLTGKEIYEMVIIARTLGGHMMWPLMGQKGKMTINQARGFSWYGDRIDLTLYAVQQFYLENMNAIVNKTIKKSLMNDKNTQWLQSFGESNEGFKTFINNFKLNSFTDSNYNIYNLATFDDKSGAIHMELLQSDKHTVPKEREKFLQYMHGNLYCIQERNVLIGL